VSLRAGLDTEARGKILGPYRGSDFDRPVRSQAKCSVGMYIPAKKKGYVATYVTNSTERDAMQYLICLCIRQSLQRHRS